MVHYVRDDGGEEAEQHDRRAGIHDRVQKLPGVWGERQHLLQILRQNKREREKHGRSDKRNHKHIIIKSEQEPSVRRDKKKKHEMMSSTYARAQYTVQMRYRSKMEMNVKEISPG